MKMLDIYFAEEYGKLCETIDGGQCTVFECKTNNGIIKNLFIKKELPWLIDGKQYYDIVTPYGYGGPIIYECSNKKALLQEYVAAFEKYCKDNRIVSEFIRFHPIFKNYEDFRDIYEVLFSRHTVGTNIKDYVDPVQGDFGKSARREVRQAENEGVVCTVHPFPDNLELFKKLYEETMDRNNADKMYYFPDSYYSFLTNELRNYILEVRAHYLGEVIASELYFIAGDIMHAHLIGSNQLLLDLGAGALLEATAARWGKENNYRYIHHGGGRTSAPDDSLFLYKKKFGKHTEFDFYIGKKVWNQRVYDLAIKAKMREGKIRNPDFFPAYRG